MSDEQHQPHASHGGAYEAQLHWTSSITVDHPARAETGEHSHDQLDHREAGKIGDERRLLRTEDRFAVSPPMKDPSAGEENGKQERGKLAICGYYGSEQEHRSRDDQFGYGQRDAGEMDETSGKGPGYERERQRPEVARKCSYNADGDDECEVVNSDYRMPDTGKQPLSESLRKLTAHRVMGECRAGARQKERPSACDPYSVRAVDRHDMSTSIIPEQLQAVLGRC